MDEEYLTFGEGNFRTTLSLANQTFIILINVKDIQKSNNYHRFYYKKWLQSLTEKLVSVCSEYKISPNILLPYLQQLIEKFNYTCSKFEQIKILLRSEKPQKIYENECVFYFDKVNGTEKLYLCYKDKEGKIINNELENITNEDILTLKSLANHDNLVSALLKTHELLQKCMEPIRHINIDLPSPICLQNIQTAFICFSEAIVENFNVMFRRIKKDMEKIIKPAFLNDFQQPILTGIFPTGSDLHNRANQVFILEFGDQNTSQSSSQAANQITRRVIYKPSPVEADAMIFGNNQKLGDFMNEYQSRPSFIEIMNKGLNQNDKLPTYLIVPCEEKEKKGYYEVVDHYGYMEYLSRELEFKIKYNETEDVAEKRFEKQIQENPSGYKNYVLNNPDDQTLEIFKEQYSLQAGLYISLMLATGLVDSHEDNIIAKIIEGNALLKIYRYLIDGEICFSFVRRNLENTSCCGGIGSLRMPMRYYNKQHIILVLKDNKVYPLPMYKERIIEGINKGLTSILQQKTGIDLWFENIIKMNFFVRLPPASTFYLNTKIIQIYQNCFDKEKMYDEILCPSYETKDFLLDDKEFESVRFPLYMKPNNICFLDEAKYLSMATCYIKINDNKLYLSNGETCIVPGRNEVVQLLKEGVFSEKENEKCVRVLDKYYQSRYPEKDNKMFLVIPLCEDARTKLTDILSNIDDFLINKLDINVLQNISYSQPSLQQNQCNSM